MLTLHLRLVVVGKDILEYPGASRRYRAPGNRSLPLSTDFTGVRFFLRPAKSSDAGISRADNSPVQKPPTVVVRR